MRPCGVCGAPRPEGYVYCRSCNHYDTWIERRPLPATLRQIFVGTLLVGLLSYLVNLVVDGLIEDSDEKAAAQTLLLREYEDAHGELGKLREGLVSYIVRSTQTVNLCAEEPPACLAELKSLRVTLRQELLVFDWDAPLAFSLSKLSVVPGASFITQLITQAGSLGPKEVERAIDTAATFSVGLRDELVALDTAWSACRGDGCDAVARCRELYAQAETYCIEYVACAAFEAEADLRARIIQQIVPKTERTGYTSSYCRDPPDVPAQDRKGVLLTRTLCGASATAEEKACEILERNRAGLDDNRRCPIWAPFQCKGADPVPASTLAREALPVPAPAPKPAPDFDFPDSAPVDGDTNLVPPGGRPPHHSAQRSGDANLVSPGGIRTKKP